MKSLIDLREILRYVPQFREKVFVIAMDGAIVDEPNFANLMLDIALLRSLRINVALVHGAGRQLNQLAHEAGHIPSNLDGIGITDAETMKLAVRAANGVSHQILQGLCATDLRGAAGNAIVAHPAGILQGVDHQLTGRIERVDGVLIRALLEKEVIPVIPPLGWDGEGNVYRLNSDAVAVEVARALEAVKLIYLTTSQGVCHENQLLRQLTLEEAEALLRQEAIDNRALFSKVEHAVRAGRGGVPRVHIIDGRVEEGLLAEVFSNEGVGTLIYANEYQAIRRAQRRDSRAIFGLIQGGMESEELRRRSLAEVERQADEFYVFQIDRSPVGCVALHFYREGQAELACLCVDPRYDNQGIGGKLMRYVEEQARAGGASDLFCLSTQAFNYFVQKGGFQIGTPSQLPSERREMYERSGRRSQVLIKKL
jgi:amino-acid N-acetyltransferase